MQILHGVRQSNVGETAVAFLGQNQVIEESNAEEFASLAQPFGQDTIHRAGRDIARGMIVRTDPGPGIHENERLEDFTRMENGQIERACIHDINPDELVLSIQAADEELFPVQTGKHSAENRRSPFRPMHGFRIWNSTALAEPCDTVPRNAVFPSPAQWTSTVRGPRELSTDTSASF